MGQGLHLSARPPPLHPCAKEVVGIEVQPLWDVARIPDEKQGEDWITWATAVGHF